MTDLDAPESSDDINEAVGAEWESETTPAERVRAVISHTYTPMSASAVAEDARTSPKTARKHLEAQANEGYVTAEPGDHGGRQYRRSPESLVVEQAAAILNSVSTEELVDRIGAMRERLSELRAEYGVESPEELAVEDANRALSGEADVAGINPETLQEWQTTRRNLAFANAALSIANAERFVEDGSSSADGGVPVQ